jgi:D-glycero-D-manno-heptose 1,7-bisphosphate phosphatase
MNLPRPLAFLDRDGTINEDFGYVSKIEDWKFLDGSVEAMRQLQQAGFGLAIVTNQSGVARGMYGENDTHLLHEFMRAELQKAEVTIDAIAVCPHGPQDHCPCRKPATGLAKVIENQVPFKIDWDHSWMIGDKPSDVEFGHAIGVRTALLQGQYWRAENEPTADICVDSLATAAIHIVNGHRNRPNP